MTDTDATLNTDGPLPTGKEKERAVRAMFDRIAPRYDALNRILTFGLDMRWRRRAIRALQLPAASRVLDVACGTGDFCRELAGAGLVPLGLDVSWGMLVAGRARVPLVQADALRLPIASGAVDGSTCGFALRNVVDLPGLFGELGRVLRPGGRVSILEVAEPTSSVIRAGHRLYFRQVVPRIGGLLSDRPAYRYLPKSTAYLPPLDELLAMLSAAGFTSVRSVPLAFGAVRVTTGTRLADPLFGAGAPLRRQ
ncbi:MAG: ubiquinone/menaquinone biosynthesis methyltransferase [Mycobacteriales bacterium]